MGIGQKRAGDENNNKGNRTISQHFLYFIGSKERKQQGNSTTLGHGQRCFIIQHIVFVTGHGWIGGWASGFNGVCAN